MIGGLIFIAILMALVVTGLVGYFLYIKFKEKDDPDNADILLNFMPQYSEGYAMGVITDKEFSEDRIGVTFYPRDVDYINATKGSNDKKLKAYTIYYRNKDFFPLAMSGHRNIWLGLPPRPEDIPEQLKTTPIGKMLMKMISESDSTVNEVEILRKSKESDHRILLKSTGGEIAEDAIFQLAEINKDLHKATASSINKPIIPKKPGA